MMRLAGLLILACVSTFDAATAQSLQIERIPLDASAPSSMGQRFVQPVAEESFTVTFYKVAPRQRATIVLPTKSSDQAGASLALIFKLERPIAAMNGGFLRTTLPATPAGYVQVDLNEINAPAPLKAEPGKSELVKADPVFSGFVCFDKSKPTVIGPTEKLRETKIEYQDCLEGGPLILYEGKPAVDLDRFDETFPQYKRFVARRVERSFVARTARGETLLGVTSPTSLLGLRAVLAADEKSGGLAATAAITLTGRSTAGLMVRGEDGPIVTGSTSAFLPNAIVVRD